MSFGKTLKPDQVIPVIKNVTAGVDLIQEFREFIKERAALEKEYGARLEGVIKKYRTRRALGLGSLTTNGDSSTLQTTRASSIEVGSVLNSGGANNLGLDPEQSTLLRAISCVLDKTEKIALERFNFAEKLTQEINVFLKSLVFRTEEACKKAFNVNKRLVDEKQGVLEDMNKAKIQYEESCLQVQSSLLKQDKAQEPKSLEKINRQCFHEVIDRNNNKNLYILAVEVANQLQEKHFNTDMPALLDHLQTLNESWMVSFKSVLAQLLDIEVECTNESTKRMEEGLESILKIDHKVETSLIALSHPSSWLMPPKSEFEGFAGFEESDGLIDEEASRTFLYNKLYKAQAQLRELDTNIAVKRNELEGLGNLCSAYLENPALGDLNEIREHMFEVWRDLAFLDNSHLGFQTEANLILASVGDLPTGQIHDFKAASFTIPTTCDYCENTIWGLSRHGASCKECGYNCHAKCELKAPLNCASAKGGSKADRRPPADLSTLAAKTAHFLKANVRSPLPASFLEPKPKSEPITAVALYDYDKTDDAELTIRENQIVEILVADDGSGWVTARLNGNTGLVPAAYISTSDIASTGIMAQAIYDFDAQAETDLSIRAGELIEVTNQNVAEGWWEGKLNGRIGQFPADYVKIV